MSDEPEIITITDIRRTGHCARGIKKWFERNGFDFRDFLKNGIEVEKFLSTGDGQAQQVVDRKRGRTGNG